MATSDSTFATAQSNEYKFSINGINISFTDGADVKISSDKDYKLTLKSLRYHKKIYQPGFIEAKLLLKQNAGTKTVPTKDEVVTFFKNKSVDLTQNGSSSKDIAKGYYVYKVMPEYLRETKADKSTEPYINVTLHIYSPDHKLTLDKYCKTHVNKKLMTDILAEEVNSGILKKAGFTKDTVDSSNRRFLNYSYVTGYTDNDLTKPNFGLREFIQPYLVQYNESFFDFLSRTANRCGEYLYYEDGKLYVGLKKSNSTGIVDTNKALSVSYQDADESLVDTTTYYLNSSGKDAGSYVNFDAKKMREADEEKDQKKKEDLMKAAKKSPVDYPFYDEIPFDDYFGLNFKKDNFSSWGKEFFKGLDELVSFLNSLLNMSTPTKMLAKLTVKYGDAALMAQSKVVDANRKGNEKWVKEKDGTDKNRHASEQYDSNTKEATLYGSKLNSSEQNENYDIKQNLNAKFYRFIADGCQKVSNQLVRINVGTEATPYLLGEEVALKAVVTDNDKTVNSSDNKYIVTEVSEVLMCDDAQRNLEDWQMGQRITVVPYYSKTVKQGGQSATLVMPCPPVVLPFVKTSGPQRAYVAESGDPGKLGRVCIRYPWQNQDDVSSPWIRMAVPFAPNDSSNGGGMLFTPDTGDEVLVDYENGNIEHPYVIGSLYTGRAKAPGKGRSIVSKRGHRLTFNDDDSVMDFMTGVLPALKIAKNFGTLISFGNETDFGEDNDFCGGTTITDKWGIYKIDASSTKRKITIQSPFGDVSISALSGIDISAPNGNVTIKGKNVSIEAGNEVSIVSGKFIDEKKIDMKSFGESYLKDLVTNVVSDYVAPIADFSLLRTVFEALVKPAAGTLNIQSGRYLLLNAGGGKAEIPNKGYSVKGLLKQESAAEDKVKMANTIRTIDTFVDGRIGTLWGKYKAVQNAMAVYVKYDDKHKKLKLKDLLNAPYDGKWNYKDDDFDYLPVFKNDAAFKLEVWTAAKTLKMAVRDLKSSAEFIKDGGGIISQDEKTYGVELKPIVESCLPPIIKDISDGKDKEFKKTEADFEALKTPFKRMLFDKTNEKAKVLLQNPPKGKTKITFNSIADYDNIANWDKFISYLDDYNTVNNKLSLAASLADSVKKQMEKNVPFTANGWSYENNLWDTCKQGEILMSDKGQKETINIVNGALNRTPNTDDYLDEVKDQLRNM